MVFKINRKKNKKKIYLANPYGFSLQQRERLLPEIIGRLESLGLEVWEPFSRNEQVDFANEDWAYEVAQKDLNDIRECDAIFAIVNGTIPDEGVMVELGFAMALGKKVFLFRDDFRISSDNERYPLNLMLFASLPKEGWTYFYYTSVEDITNIRKNLYRWSQQ